jgi:hypothetical protein
MEDGSEVQGCYREKPDLHAVSRTVEELRRPWIVDHSSDGVDFSEEATLAAIESTLPPHRKGRDREVHFESDGTIVYTKEEGNWEPPREINGYRRDADDPWRFIPLWKSCVMRQQSGVRHVSCGCIDIVMRCGNPECLKFGGEVKHTDCDGCPMRREII